MTQLTVLVGSFSDGFVLPHVLRCANLVQSVVKKGWFSVVYKQKIRYTSWHAFRRWWILLRFKRIIVCKQNVTRCYDDSRVAKKLSKSFDALNFSSKLKNVLLSLQNKTKLILKNQKKPVKLIFYYVSQTARSKTSFLGHV